MDRVPVVVTGVGVLSPLGRNAEEFWSNLVAGRRAVVRAESGELAGAFAGVVPDEWLPVGDDERNTALAVVAAREALDHAGLDSAALGAAEVGLVLGKCQGTPDASRASYAPFHETCDEIAERFALTGPRVVISTACAAGANAVGTGRDLLWDGSAEIVLAGGVDILLAETLAGFASLQAVAPGPTAPYSESTGLSLGEGAAFLVLETRARAEARGARILADVAGYGLSADAYHATSPDPSGRGAISAVRRGLADAGLTVDDVSYVNGHGTGTPANDTMEKKAMATLFGDRVSRVPISGTKSAIGHSLGASGAIEAVACVLAVHTGTVPPTVGFREPYPTAMDFVPNRGRPADVEVTVSNNYAFGGNNCSLVLTRPGRKADRPPLTDGRIVVSGLGAVGGTGVGLDAWRAGLTSGESWIRRLEHLDGYGVEPPPLTGRPLAAPGLWRHMDAFARQALAAAVAAWNDAKLPASRSGRDTTGLVFATGYGPIRSTYTLATAAERGEGPSALLFSGATINAPGGAVCQALSLRGPTTTVASGGSSAILGLDAALWFLRTGQAERMLLLAADDLCEPVLRERAKREALAPDGVARPYDRGRAGPVLGAASVALVLEPAETVAARGGRAYCEVTGVAHSSAGRETDVLRRALSRAATTPDDVDLCVGSGSGSAYDVVEARALGAVFSSRTSVTAPKSITGECEAASGAVNLLVGAVALAEGLVPPTVNLVEPLPDVALAHVTEPGTGSGLRRVVATATSPNSTFGAAVLASVG
ncbi:beta-ketoacyl-[acyl-carrier-protein] synthase family protein [Cryptosporangium aurantiacum]|uniref:3-oxoacyl-[acyl-carrier-protein] synthase II n=1 Tax=Cryptosporangium aurantiacum TaxID=134849 RepID=A0A1M7QAU8_9ACTN|nr:beta-ketoacyl-[acyl-carrier-protein] synthase family protein [Cryptosporangium aurantiacum]SHN27662.1 3-oxoacyl-[acyl-carrier-protein] synthase II [Cryptosporangium aurantiacum]